MKKLAIVLLGMLAAVSSFAVFYLPLTTEPIENAILPTIAAAAVGLASGAIIGRLSGPAGPRCHAHLSPSKHLNFAPDCLPI